MDPVKKLSRSVRGLSVLVTGAASGMGRATARVFAAEGAHVAVNLDLTAHEGARRVHFAGVYPDKGLAVGFHGRDAAGQVVGLLDLHFVIFYS